VGSAAADRPVIRVEGLSKAYHLWASPQARLFAPLLVRLARSRVVPGSLARRFEGVAERVARPFFALRDVSLDVRHNESVGLVGRNGSGKSTLLQIIAGTVTPTLGRVSVEGRVAALLELGTGFDPDFTGRENVHLNAAILGLTEEETTSRFEAIAEFADIGDFIEQPVKTYSSGMYVRLAFAVAINVDADVLIVDEALSVGDEAFQRKCFARIERFRERGGTILFVSHSASAVVELCDRALLLDSGEVLTAGSPKAVVAAYHKLLYGGAGGDPRALRERIRSAGAEGLRDEDSEEPPREHPGGEYDPALVPRSTLAYESDGAEIRAARLTTPAGRRVNVLELRGEYVYEYEVAFSEARAEVRFGMMIRSIIGLEIGGAISAPPSEAIESVAAGSVLRVRFRFRCNVAAGTYFLNAGVLGRVAESEGEVFLHRLIDVVMFRVSPEPGSLMTGAVDFMIEPEVSVLS
jgi:lipopolysaccharide transport system ATP-binding protein